MIQINSCKSDKKARSMDVVINGKKIKTPFFMPVATKAAARHLTTKDLSDIGINAMIANSMLLSLNPGSDFIHSQGGLHKFMGYNKIMFTDSGGFQVMRPFFKKMNNDEIEFVSPFDNTVHKISPKIVMETQIKIDSDVAMVLDHMPLANASNDDVIASMDRTFKWAKFQKEYHDGLKLQYNSNQNLFGIIQGGYDVSLRKKALNEITSLDFDGYALGGLAIGEPRETMNIVFREVIDLMPSNKLRYIMGIGHPIDILEAVEHGADCFDSVYPTQTARHNQIFTSQGIIKLINSKYKDDQTPLDPNCECYVCKNFSRAYLRYLTKIDEPIAYQLKSYHAVHWMNNFMKEIQESICEGRFEEYKENFMKNYN